MRAQVFLEFEIFLFDDADLQSGAWEELRSASKRVRWAIALPQCVNLLYIELPWHSVTCLLNPIEKSSS